MKNLHFIFKINNKTIYDEVVNFLEEDGYLCFKLDEQDFKLRLEEFHFVKVKNDEKFEIRGGKSPKVLVTLLKENATFLVEIKSYKIKNKGNIYKIDYVLESDDDDEEKTIIFKFL